MRVLLILPCMPWIKYGFNFREGKFWKKVIESIRDSKHQIDIYAIDCIRLKSTGSMIGLWSPETNKKIFHEVFSNKLDNYPAWHKYKNKPNLREELKQEVRRRLEEVCQKYDKIISFTNVKVYYYCMKELAEEFNIIALPRSVNWKAPRAVAYENIDQLVNELENAQKVIA